MTRSQLERQLREAGRQDAKTIARAWPAGAGLEESNLEGYVVAYRDGRRVPLGIFAERLQDMRKAAADVANRNFGVAREDPK